MYPSYQYQQPSSAPPPSQSQQPTQPGHPPPYGYSYPPPQQSAPQPLAPAPGYAQYPQPGYPYPAPPPGYYYPQTGGYPTAYAGHPPQTYPAYSRPPYTHNTIPAQYPQYPAQPYPTDGYNRGPPAQSYQGRPLSGHSSPPSSKRQKLDPRPSHVNGSHSHSHKQSRNPTKEKKTFSDFRISKIKVGEFVAEETRLDTDIRDSRLRFYFRSLTSNASPRPGLTPTNIVAQSPDRISVSLHKGTRRIVIPASNLKAVHFNRGQGYIKIEGDGFAAFEEIRPDDMDDTASMTSKSGYAGPKFIGSDVDPTEGEWARSKIMEIWLNTTHPLTEPKWTRGNLRDNIDQSSLFQYIIHVTDQEGSTLSVASFDEMIESWNSKSLIGTVEARAGFIADLSGIEKLVDLVERTVQMMYSPLVPAVERLLTLVKKDVLQEELKQVVLRLPYEGVCRALDTILVEDMDRQMEDTQSVLSSVVASTKREREEDADEEMGSVGVDGSSVQREQSIHTIAADGETDTLIVSVNGTGDGAADPVPEEDEEKAFIDFDV